MWHWRNLMYNSSHTSDLSSSMSSSSVSSAMLDENELALVSKSVDIDGLSKSAANGSVQSVIESVAINVVKNLFLQEKYDEVIKVTTELLEEKETAFLFKARGESFAKLHMHEKSIKDFFIALELDDACYKTHNNIGLAYKEMGMLANAAQHLEKAIRLNQEFSEAYNNYGNVKSEQSDLVSARKSYLKSIDLRSDDPAAFWNLHSTCNDIDHAKAVLELCIEKDRTYEPAIYSLATINAYKGNNEFLDWILASSMASDSTLRSVQWILSLPEKPKLLFNRWAVLDFAIRHSLKNRAFYEFGVWMGESFRYIFKNFERSYGFDSFEGLPEDWHNIKMGTYSSYGQIPKLNGPEFVVGNFEETLPRFFSEAERPLAGLINLDADLYSSTICALDNSHPVIDDKTILVFDELIVNQNWEEDEFKALIEYCKTYGLSYEVSCVSLFTKQVVLRVYRP